MRIVYIGIDLLYPALPALAELCELEEIVTCQTDNVTEFNTSVCSFAKERKIPLKIGRVTAQDAERWEKHGCDAVICAGYYYRLPVNGTLRMVNIHPSLLPEGRGAWPMPQTILRGLRESGVTVHKMTENFDEGDILLQRRIPVEPSDNLKTLTDRQKALLPELMRELVQSFDVLWRKARPQGPGEYWKLVEESDLPINPQMDRREADRILRAFMGYECIYDTGSERWGIIGGVISEEPGENGELPVQGAYIRAERIRKLGRTDRDAEQE